MKCILLSGVINLNAAQILSENLWSHNRAWLIYNLTNTDRKCMRLLSEVTYLLASQILAGDEWSCYRAWWIYLLHIFWKEMYEAIFMRAKSICFTNTVRKCMISLRFLLKYLKCMKPLSGAIHKNSQGMYKAVIGCNTSTCFTNCVRECKKLLLGVISLPTSQIHAVNVWSRYRAKWVCLLHINYLQGMHEAVIGCNTENLFNLAKS